MPYSVRDLLGHFVKPRSAKGKMCPHACCRNKRVHPDNMPVILPNQLLRRASDEDLAAHYDRVQGDSRKDERARAQVLHEMERRDAAAEGRKAREHAKFSRQLEQADAVEASYVHAEAATRGHMLNRKGESRGINPRTLITGREETFRRYASDELLEYYSTHHRPTAASFRGRIRGCIRWRLSRGAASGPLPRPAAPGGSGGNPAFRQCPCRNSLILAILELMHDDRPQADRILVAQLTGEARHLARWRELTADEEAAAVAELRALAGGRADLLAEVTGIFEGASEGRHDESLARCAAGLCRKAGADAEAIPAWIEEGGRRAAQAGLPPFSGGIHSLRPRDHAAA